MFKNRKQKAFGKFDIAGYCQRRYKGHGESEHNLKNKVFNPRDSKENGSLNYQ
jgi:hypothetical protein